MKKLSDLTTEERAFVSALFMGSYSPDARSFAYLIKDMITHNHTQDNYGKKAGEYQDLYTVLQNHGIEIAKNIFRG